MKGKPDCGEADAKRIFANELSEHLVGSSDHFVAELCRRIITVDPVDRVRSILLSPGGIDGGKSKKVENIRMNLKEILAAIAGGTLLLESVFEEPWQVYLAVFVTLNALDSACRVDLSRDEATVLWAMWIHCDSSSAVEAVLLAEKVNLERKKYCLSPISSLGFRRAIEKLEKHGVIGKDKRRPKKWKLRESVSIH